MFLVESRCLKAVRLDQEQWIGKHFLDHAEELWHNCEFGFEGRAPARLIKSKTQWRLSWDEGNEELRTGWQGHFMPACSGSIIKVHHLIWELIVDVNIAMTFPPPRGHEVSQGYEFQKRRGQVWIWITFPLITRINFAGFTRVWWERTAWDIKCLTRAPRSVSEWRHGWAPALALSSWK